MKDPVNEIVRGTTPPIIYTLPFQVDGIDVGFLVVKQGQIVVIERSLSECICEGNTVTAKLTQEETLALESNCNADVRLVVKTYDGNRLETVDSVLAVSDTHKDEVI
jgi:hypothetical protein